MNLASDPGFPMLLRRLEGHPLPPLAMYKDKCLQRRLAVRMRACGVQSLSEYADLLDRHPGEVDRLLQALTINVTHFFRNATAWQRLGGELEQRAVAGQARFAAWSAGCASGEEAYTVAMLLAATLERAGLPLSAATVRVDATDVDEASLALARLGRYPAAAFGEAPVPEVKRWTVVDGEGRRIEDAVRAVVRVLRHDLGRDPAPEPPYDLVVCRNVLIYFERDVQERLFHLFAEALCPGGVLLLGKVESLYGPARERFEPVDGRERLFRRIR
jgi:chemotaxis methyl-accepting protein methylase